ncbi:MAG: Ribosomal protein S6E/S10 [Candidatus Methanohalarchaeum thermophilum]|uniref:Small ribosomal subunit protein eS6 n=1 Tax=Methanohalarchaeum thermophilum TaxID=1903181 RepID=A0A1Q6DRW8_METT1|nr:MAG: Ribosomal protein S6E/S10 [Candidatus Methanohalarchaeum thermophilum]
MAEFKLVISNPNDGNAKQLEVTGKEANSLVGKRIGDTLEGDKIGFQGYLFEIKGGTDQDGFPMTKRMSGPQKEKVLMKGGTGFNPTRDGLKERKTVRGSEISEKITQINLSVKEVGNKDFNEIMEE